jgi:hypothetical protein
MLAVNVIHVPALLSQALTIGRISRPYNPGECSTCNELCDFAPMECQSVGCRDNDGNVSAFTQR